MWKSGFVSCAHRASLRNVACCGLLIGHWGVVDEGSG